MPMRRISQPSGLPVRSEVKKWLLAFTILGHVLFRRNLEGVDTIMLQFQEQIEQGRSFIPALPDDTIRASCALQRQLFRHTWNAISHSYKYDSYAHRSMQTTHN